MAKAPKKSAQRAKKSSTAKSQRGRRSRRASKLDADPDNLELGTDKLYFKIGEVSDIVDVAPHVLRYWESEFSIVKPQKSRSQQRVYRRKDVENLLRIKHLLYARKFTIAGARQELRGGVAKIERARVSGLYRARQSLGRVKEQLEQLAAAVRTELGPAELAADPAAFVRDAGGAQGLLGQRRDAQGRGSSAGPQQPMLDRPDRPDWSPGS